MNNKSVFKIKNILFLTLITFLFACSGNKSDHIPDNVLSIEKMAAFLTDTHILEAAMNLNISNEIKSADESREGTMQALLEKHKITKEQYDSSFKFYGEHPELFEEVYKQVLNNLSEIQAKTSNEKEVIANDSLKKDSVKTPVKKP